MDINRIGRVFQGIYDHGDIDFMHQLHLRNCVLKMQVF